MKHKYRNLTICLFVFFISLYAIPSVLARTRHSYLTSFVLNNEIEKTGFSNAIEGSFSYEATAYAIEILASYVISPHEVEDLKSNLEARIKNMFDDNLVNLYNLFYSLKSLDILEHVIDSALSIRIHKYLNDTEQAGGGFSYSNSSTSVSLTSIYYVFQLYSLIEKPVVNISLHKNWILSCNNSDGGYGGNRSLSSTLINTYFATTLFYDMGDVNDLADINLTLIYLKSLYVNETADLNNFGGYYPNDLAIYALLSSTYFCVKSISVIEEFLGSTEMDSGDISSWVLSRQNYLDGGFVENSGGSEQGLSSVVTSYYAFETLKILETLSSLNNEIWMVEFNFWILGIILMLAGIVIAAIVFIWRKRRI